MGLSASQARLLSITARLTHNETESQLITNSKLRLSDKSAEASEDYIEALNSTQYLYSYYDSTGSKSYYDLTVGTVTQFSEIKNQYGFVDAQGRLLVSETDAANFEDSDTLADFLYCYGVSKTEADNSAFFTKMYGTDYESYYDADDAEYWYNLLSGTRSIASDYNNNIGSENDFTSWSESLTSSISSLYTDSSIYQLLGNSSGQLGTYYSALTADLPDYVKDPGKFSFDFSSLISAYNSSQCYSYVAASDSGIGHMEHNLSNLIWYSSGIVAMVYQLAQEDPETWGNYVSYDEDTGYYTLTNSDGTISVTSTNGLDNESTSLTNYSFDADDDATTELLSALSTYSDSADIQQAIQDLIDLYCAVINYLDSNGCVGSGATDLDSSSYSISSSVSADSADTLYETWQAWYTSLAAANVTDSAAIQDTEEYQEWLAQVEAREEFEAAMKEWYNDIVDAREEYEKSLQNIPEVYEPDTTDTKYQWYVNLWYRMGGKTASSKVSNPQNYYKVLGDEYMYNSDWLKFALEHGIVTMEQVQYQEEGETTAEEMNQYAWTSITYTSCADLTEESDETAIAKAEVEYEQISAEIQAKDKKYDNDLKDLDTEHDALQTEYESIKSVIEKNVERSFKAFS